MVAHGTALVPTAMNLDNFPTYADQAGEKFPAVVMMGAGWMVVPDIKPGK